MGRHYIKMKKISILVTLLLIVSVLVRISALDTGGVSYCCERTIIKDDGSGGAWCVNAPEQECDPQYRKAPASCEATSYCKKGCCYDSQEGICMENTPMKVCEEAEGVWSDSPDCDIPQCELGCCRIGDQASFVTLTKCKRMGYFYGIDIFFDKSIKNELQCLMSINSQKKGACVYMKNFEKDCKVTTQEECMKLKQTLENVTFHQEFLCTAEDLGTKCVPTEKTTCVEGKDQVYFVDSCGNICNVYDATKIRDKEYWRKIKDPSESCNYGQSNAGSPSCGNCDYYLGSVCKKYERSDGRRPSYGDYICKDLSCEWNGRKYKHGESWCAVNQKRVPIITTEDNKFFSINAVGSKFFRLICYEGEVTVEPCAEYRQEICKESSVNGFKTAACIANKWQDCTEQDNRKDCENRDVRDCKWIGGNNKIKCVPIVPPGLDFWNPDGDAEKICSSATATCKITCHEKFGGDMKCESEPAGCGKDDDLELNPEWIEKVGEICFSMGDCSSEEKVKTNYIGDLGFYDEEEK